MEGYERFKQAIGAITDVLEEKSPQKEGLVDRSIQEALVQVFQDVFRGASKQDQNLLYFALAEALERQTERIQQEGKK